YAFRFTNPMYQGYEPGKSNYTMKTLHDQLFQQLPNNPQKMNDSQKAYVKDFSEQLVKSFKRVLNNDKPIAQINAARCLADLTKWGAEEIADALVEVLKEDGYSDAVKFYALQGLKNLFILENPDDPKKSIFQNSSREAKSILALLEFLQRKPPLPE